MQSSRFLESVMHLEKLGGNTCEKKWLLTVLCCVLLLFSVTAAGQGDWNRSSSSTALPVGKHQTGWKL